MNILQACRSPKVFGPWFKDPSTWQAWFAFLAALFGLPMTDDQLATYRKHTGRLSPPEGVQREAWLICGRRAGKSFIMALVAVFLATFRNYREYLQPGERATVAVIAADRKQARIVLRYIRAMLTGIPTFKAMLERETAEGFDLVGQVTIEVATASATSTRGYSYAAVIADEVAHWPIGEGAAETDEDILAAIKPGMLTIPAAMLICASSPHARKGAMWEAFQHFGKDGGPLVWQAETLDMNPRADRKEIEAAYVKDHAAASAEFGAQFRKDIEAYVTREIVEACVEPGVYERHYQRGVAYRAFCDPSGGAKDSMTLAIGHNEGGRAVIDAVRERKAPFKPSDVVAEFADLLKVYGLSTTTGDRYGGEWPRERFQEHGITYRLADKVRSDLYRDALPLLNSGQVDLLDLPIIVTQFVGLERRVMRGGRESIDHARNSHDDVVNSIAGVLDRLANRATLPSAVFSTYTARAVRGAVVEELPLPAWARSPETVTAQAAVDAYLSRRAH